MTPKFNDALREEKPDGTRGKIVSNVRRNVMDLDPEVPKWEMQPLENPEHFELFRVFRDMGPSRTISAVAEMVAKTDAVREGVTFDSETYQWRLSSKRVHVQRIATEKRWWERVQAYDRHMDRIALDEQEKARREAVREVSKRHAHVAKALTNLAGRKLEEIFTERLKETLEKMSLGELMALSRNGIALERMIHGVDAIENEATKATPDNTPQQSPTVGFEELKRVARVAAAEVASGQYDPDPPAGPPRPASDTPEADSGPDEDSAEPDPVDDSDADDNDPTPHGAD